MYQEVLPCDPGDPSHCNYLLLEYSIFTRLPQEAPLGEPLLQLLKQMPKSDGFQCIILTNWYALLLSIPHLS